MVGYWMALLVAGLVIVVHAAGPTIGIATGRGSFLLNNSSISGNATVFEGAVLETSSTPSVVSLQNGSRMQLGVASRAKFYGDRLVLEKGAGELETSQAYRIEAEDLRIVPESSGAATRVALREHGKVAVVAMRGSANVTKGDGTLVARLETGTALEFALQDAGASAPVSVSGCLAVSPGGFLLNDETAKVTFELRGQDLAKYAGQRVSVSAVVLRQERPGQGATQVIQATAVKVLGGSCPVPGATVPGNSRPTATAKAGAAGTTGKAVIAGVAIAAVAGGAAVGLAGEEKSTISR
jgi:hypothetical protein